MKVRVLIVMFFVIVWKLPSQDRTIDSLNIILKNAMNDTTRCNTLKLLIENEMDDKAITTYNNQLYNIAKKHIVANTDINKNKYFKYYADAIQNTGNLYNNTGNITKAIDFYSHALKIYQLLRSDENCVEAFNNIGYAFMDQGNMPKAIEYYLEALKVSEKINNDEYKAFLYNNIGYAFQQQGDTNIALDYYLKSLDIKKNLGNELSLAVAYDNMGSIYGDKKKLKDAMNYYLKGLEIRERLNDLSGMSGSYINLGGIYYEEKDFVNTELYYLKALKINEQNGFKTKLANTLNNLASLKLVTNKLDEAIAFGNKGMKLSYEINHPERIYEASNTLKSIYIKKKNFTLALKMYEIEMQMMDSMKNDENRRLSFQKSTQYTYEKKALIDSLKIAEQKSNRDLKLQKEITIRKNLILTVFSVVLIIVILMGLAVFLNKTIKERKKAYITLQEKNIEIQYQSQKLVELSKQITKYQTQMNPHFVFNALNSIQGFVVNNEKEKTLTQLQNFSKLMRSTLNNSANETITLKTELDFLKLYVAFENERFLQNINFTISSVLNEDETSIQPMLIQPLIENCLKHAGLNNVDFPSIQLVFKEVDDLLQVSVIDNGKGISIPIEEAFAKSHALGILKSRLKLIFEQENKHYLDEYILIKSIINQGADISFFVPLITKF